MIDVLFGPSRRRCWIIGRGGEFLAFDMSGGSLLWHASVSLDGGDLHDRLSLIGLRSGPGRREQEGPPETQGPPEKQDPPERSDADLLLAVRGAGGMRRNFETC
jgi:hypothetical protein